MAIERLGTDGFIATGEHIPFVRLVTLRARLKIEMAGMRVRGQPTATILRNEFGWPERKREALLRRLNDLINTKAKELQNAQNH